MPESGTRYKLQLCDHHDGWVTSRFPAPFTPLVFRSPHVPALHNERCWQLNVNRLLSITNRNTLWKTFDSSIIDAESLTLGPEDDFALTAENITFGARSNVNVNAAKDVVIKGTKINDN
jgi:hypothetical protein